MTRETVRDVLEAANIGFRCEGIKFINICQRNRVLLAIVSGGISDVIATMLSTVIDISNYPLLKLIGNELVFKNNILIKYEEKLNFVAKNISINNEIIGFRKNIIAIGDTIDDTNMVNNVDYENLICIGFLNSPTNLEEELKAYL